MRIYVKYDPRFGENEQEVAKRVTLPQKISLPVGWDDVTPDGHPGQVIEKKFIFMGHEGVTVNLIGEEEILLVPSPKNYDFKKCRIKVDTVEEVSVVANSALNRWEVSIPPSTDKGSNAPGDVNLTIVPEEDDDLGGENGGT